MHKYFIIYYIDLLRGEQDGHLRLTSASDDITLFASVRMYLELMILSLKLIVLCVL